MQYKGQLVPPAEHAGSIILRITLLICHFNGRSHCSRCAAESLCRREWGGGCTLFTHGSSHECGVDWNVLARPPALVPCNPCYHRSVHQAGYPTTPGPPLASWRPRSTLLPASLSPPARPPNKTASTRCVGNTWIVARAQNSLLNAVLELGSGWASGK